MTTTAKLTRLVLVAVAGALAVAFAVLAHRAAGGRELQLAWTWIPSIGLSLGLRVDALAGLFALLICGMGALVAGYAGAYVERGLQRFYLHLTLFFVAMLGIVVADDLLLLYVCWELTSVSSFFLIGFHSEREEARAAARHALLVTVMGGLCLFAGLIMLGHVAGTWRISELIERADTVRRHELYLPALALVALGAFTKSAQFPFHSWLPRAMQAPTPASAYLHAATMVKAGVYLLARLSPALADTSEWRAIVLPVGASTAVIGAVRAFGETRLKRALAYATVSALGILVALLGVGTKEAIVAAIVYLLAHALYKGALFLCAGAIDHAWGIQDLRELRGIARAMPRVAIATALASASLAGVPLLLGFLGKDLAYDALWPGADPSRLLSLVAVFIASALFVAIGLDVGVRSLFGRAPERPDAGRDPSPWLWGPPLILAFAGLLFGAAPRLVAPLCAAAASAVAGEPIGADAATLHGITPALILSIVTLLVGGVIYVSRAPLRRAGSATARVLRLRPPAGYELVMRALSGLADRQTRALQRGYLSWYVLAIIGTVTLLVLLALTGATLGAPARVATDVRLEDAGLVAVMLAAALVASLTASRYTAIAAMGVVGLTVGVVYLTLGAPDLAMTQFVVEILNVAVFVIALSGMPTFERLSSTARRARDALVAVAFGGVMLVLVLVASRTEPGDRVSDWFVANAVSEGHGHNVVNVILTDFRSIDTLGEIAVLACAAFGTLALLRPRKAST